MASKQQFLPEKISKFDSTLHSDLLIEWQIKNIVRKNFAGRFHLPPQPNGAMQNHLMLRPGYRSVRFLDNKCTVGILRTDCHSICAEKKNWSTLNFMLPENAPSWQCVKWMDKRTYVSLIHMVILTTIYWIWPLRPSSVFWHLWPCFHALHGQKPAINKPPTKYVKL